MVIKGMKGKGLGRRLLWTPAVLLAVLGLAAASAAQAGVVPSRPSPAEFVFAPSPAVRVPGQSPAALPMPCFSSNTVCASSDPAVTFTLESSGNTSACKYHGVVTWGQGKPATRNFPGGPDGSVVTFKHTYPKPGIFGITWTVTVTADGCQGSSGTAQFTLVTAQAAGVRYGTISAIEPGEANLPVIKDDGRVSGLPHLVADRTWGPDSCAGLTSPKDYDWLRCGTGGVAKNWPVIDPVNSPLSIDAASFSSNVNLTNSPMLYATATIGKQKLTLFPVPLTSMAGTSKGTYQLAASGTFTGALLPAKPGKYQLVITWSLMISTSVLPMGVTSSPVYVTAGKYTAPTDKGSKIPVIPLVTIVDVGTLAAAGRTSPRTVFDAIWKKFESRHIDHPVLNPATGKVAHGPELRYYKNGYSTIADWFNDTPDHCPAFDEFLASNSGHCGDWAVFLQGALAFQGITSRMVYLSDEPGFYPGPEPEHGDAAKDFGYMLIGPSLWHFGKKNASGPYSRADSLTVSDGKIKVGNQAFTYKPSPTAISQGGVRTPPEMYTTGDHAIVATKWGLVDPSYGQPQSTNPYKSIQDFDKTAIAGFAVVFYKEGSDWHPLPLSSRIKAVCATHECQFRATPYADSGAP